MLSQVFKLLSHFYRRWYRRVRRRCSFLTKTICSCEFGNGFGKHGSAGNDHPCPHRCRVFRSFVDEVFVDERKGHVYVFWHNTPCYDWTDVEDFRFIRNRGTRDVRENTGSWQRSMSVHNFVLLYMITAIRIFLYFIPLTR